MKSKPQSEYNPVEAKKKHKTTQKCNPNENLYNPNAILENPNYNPNTITSNPIKLLPKIITTIPMHPYRILIKS